MSGKSTRRALLTSALAILACVAMLVSTTFAWFTDTASTAVNTITSGNLHVEIQGEDNKPVSQLNWVAKDGRAQDEILWEPGCTYTLTPFKIVNTGNLALKYKIVITGLDGDSALLDVIRFTYTTEDGTFDMDAEGHLAANGKDGFETKFITVSATMDTAAGNEYQNKTLTGVKFTVYATQDTVEYDSIDNQYDKNAKYTEIIAGGKTFTGKQTISTGITATNPNAIAVKVIGPAADLTIEDGTFDGGAGGSNVCVAAANGATVTIKGGTFTVGGDKDGYGNSVVYSVGGNIVIEGGFFYTNYSWKGKYYVLNMNNGNPGKITVKGGTFVNFNPAGGDDQVQPTNFVAEGYAVISETKANGDVWYTVVKGNAVSSGDEFTEAVKDGGNIVFGDDVATKSGLNMAADTDVALGGKTWTVGDNTKLADGADLTVSGGKVVCGTYSGYVGVRPGTTTDGVVTYTDVDFTGLYNAGRGTRGSSTTHTDYVLKYTPERGGHVKFLFKNCTFTNSAVQFSGLSGSDGTFEAVFENCTFTALTNDALIEVSNYLTDSTITIKNCTFNVTATSNFSVIDGNYGRAATVSFEGSNTFTGVVATPTGADKKGTAEEIKIFSDNLNVKVCSAKTVNGLDTVTVSGVVKK